MQAIPPAAWASLLRAPRHRGHLLRVLTVNIHKGFDVFNRRILPELREAVREVGSDLGATSSNASAIVLEQVPDDAPLILAGDFNDWRSQSDTILGRCGLVEVFRQASGRHARTFPARWPILRLDRIHVRGVVSARPLPMPRQPWAGLSDHAPLAAEIVLPGDR